MVVHSMPAERDQTFFRVLSGYVAELKESCALDNDHEFCEKQNILMRCIKPLACGEEIDSAFLELLSVIKEFFGADFGGIFCFGDGLKHGVRHYWKTQEPFCGKTARFEREQDWKQLLRKGEQVVVRDISVLQRDAPQAYALLEEKKISSLCVTPLFQGRRMIGLLSLTNIGERWENVALLKTLGMYVAGQLRHLTLMEENSRIRYFDSVTGFRNFEQFKQEVTETLSKEPLQPYSFWYSDLKNFKYINDVFGYEAGNRILQYWANVLAEDMQKGESFARISADHFVSFRKYSRITELSARFRHAVERLAACPETARKQILMEIVSGIYLIEKKDDVLSVEGMMDRARMAQKSVKNLPGNRFAFYTEELRRRMLHNIEMETEMRNALADKKFVLFFQPQIEMQKRPGNTIRAEALVRWERREGTLACPGTFIPLFEQNGMIVELDLYVFETLCRIIKELLKTAKQPMCLSVNVSRISLLQPGFVKRYCDVKERYGIPDGTIELEFTESVAVDDYDKFRSIILQLKQSGFFCALDDFGTGQSSLNVLRNLPIDVLKLDKQFFDPSDTKRGQIVVSYVLKMAKALGIRTVAEGVEQSNQLETLKKMGCDYVQGYVFSKPVPLPEFCAGMGIVPETER